MNACAKRHGRCRRYATRKPDGSLLHGDGVQIPGVPVMLERERWDALQAAMTVHGPTPDYGLVYPLTLRIESRCGNVCTGI